MLSLKKRTHEKYGISLHDTFSISIIHNGEQKKEEKREEIMRDKTGGVVKNW